MSNALPCVNNIYEFQVHAFFLPSVYSELLPVFPSACEVEKSETALLL